MSQSTGPEGREQAERLVGDILRKTQEREESTPAPMPMPSRGRWHSRLLAVALPVLMVMTLGNIIAFMPQTTQPDRSDREDLRFELFLVAQEIHLYQEAEGRLPQDLAVLGLDDPELDYVVTDDTFRLTLADNGMTISYEPGDPDEERFAAEFAELAEEAGT